MPVNRTRSFLSLLTLAVLAACAKSGDNARSDSTAPVAAIHDTGMAGMAHDSTMARMSSMTGNPDRDFLRMMSDHHKGLIALAHETMDRKGAAPGVREDARKMDKKQDAELEKIVTTLDKQYKDDYTPKVTPDNQRMVDELKTKSGKEYSRTFLANVIKHHQQAIKMVDDYLPTAKNAEVKSMATKMKSDQTQEIARLKKELART